MDSTFEIDLLHFHGQPQELDFEIPGYDASWLLDDEIHNLKVDPHTTFHAELRAQLIGSTVHIDGFIEGDFQFQCGRCMQWRRVELDENVQFVLMSRPSWQDTYDKEDEFALSEEDLDVSYYDGEIIDLRPLIREAVLLELPTFPVCSQEDKLRCDEAFEKIVGTSTIEENESNSIDLRWSKLRDISLKNDPK